MLEGFNTSGTIIAEHIDEGIIINFWLSIFLFFTVVGPMLYLAWKYRASNVRDEDIENVTHNTVLEIVWTVVPTMMLLVFFWYGYTSMVTARTMPAANESITVDLEGKKWSWNYTYPANANGYVHKTSELYVPVSENIILNMTAPINDVIHSYFVPSFRMKEDVVPGRMTKQWFNSSELGAYDVECAEYCGTRHSYMYSKIHVIPAAEYKAWFESDLRTPGAEPVQMSKGQELYEMNGCNGCHSLADDSILVGPSLKGLAVSKSAEYMKDALLNPDKDVPDGFYPGVMPPFSMSDDELNEIIEYMKK
jgi:cytochrome c oxidase subunit 2